MQSLEECGADYRVFGS